MKYYKTLEDMQLNRPCTEEEWRAFLASDRKYSKVARMVVNSTPMAHAAPPARPTATVSDGRPFWQQAGEALFDLARDRAATTTLSVRAAFAQVADEHRELYEAYSAKRVH